MKTLVLALGLMLATMASASAALVFEGTISDPPTAVDWIYFSVDTPGQVTIDVLAREQVGPVYVGSQNEEIDHNGDGEITLLDAHIILFANPVGGPTLADYIDENDDCNPTTPQPGAGADDGSTSPYDSFLQLNLAAGEYALALGSYELTSQDAIDGFNDDALYDLRYGGDYRVTITGAYEGPGQDPVIPEPATMALIGLGLTGLAAGRRRRRA